MADEADDRGPITWSPECVRFVELSGGAMSALLDGDLPEAGRVAGVWLTECFVTDAARWLWRFRLDQMTADPGRAPWMVRQAVVGDRGLVVGHAGFHGPPGEVGMVEIRLQRLCRRSRGRDSGDPEHEPVTAERV